MNPGLNLAVDATGPLDLAELRALQALARNERAYVDPELLVRLERRRLVMRGWSGTHVPTEAAHRALSAQKAQPAPDR